MSKNIENFDGWFKINSQYDDIDLGKGELTLKVNSLKLMMKYMPIIQELDKMVEKINSFNKNTRYFNDTRYFYDIRYNFDVVEYNKALNEFEEMINDFYKKVEEYGLAIVNYTINIIGTKYIEGISLCLIQ